MSGDRPSQYRGTYPGPASSAWIALPFGAGWGDFGGGFQACQYRKVGDMVELRGLANGPAAVSTLGTLPAGFRPTTATQVFVADSGAHARVDVLASGVLSVQIKAVAGYLTISGIRFSVLP